MKKKKQKERKQRRPFDQKNNKDKNTLEHILRVDLSETF